MRAPAFDKRERVLHIGHVRNALGDLVIVLELPDAMHDHMAVQPEHLVEQLLPEAVHDRHDDDERCHAEHDADE